jgi:hypothetical protein
MPTRLDPSNDQARSWLLHELAKPPYRDTRDPFTRALQALEQWLINLLSGSHVHVTPLPTIVAILVAALLVVLIAYLMRFVRRTARGPRATSTAVLGDERLTADQYRFRARHDFDEQRYAECVLDVLRAIAQGAMERTLLEDAPSLTAHEIGGRLARVFPEASAELQWAADRFDSVAYGHERATRDDASRLLELDRTLADRRPGRLVPSPRVEGDVTSGVPAKVGS